jgi:hypothetical protein
VSTIDEPIAAMGDLLIPDVGALRQRIRNMDGTNRAALVAEAGARTLPSLADADGNTLDISRPDFEEWECLVAKFEEPLSAERREAAVQTIAALPPGPRLVVWQRLARDLLAVPVDDEQGLVGVWTLRHPLMFTVGREETILRTVRQVTAEAEAQVADVLGVVPEPGDIITRPVIDADALAAAVDWSQLDVKGVLAAVEERPELAADALAAERARPKARKGIIDKLVPLVEPEVPAASVLPAAEAGVGAEPAPPATSSGEQAGKAPESPLAGESSGTASPSPVLDPQPATPAASTDAERMVAPTSPLASAASPPTTEAEGVAGMTSPAAPSVDIPPKFLPMLRRIHAELGALLGIAEADLQRVDL